MRNRWAIHANVIVVSRRRRCAMRAFPVAAPEVIPQHGFRPEQPRPNRIQMHVVARHLQIPRRRTVHRQSLVATAEQMTEQLVAAVEPARVGAEKPFQLELGVSPGY